MSESPANITNPCIVCLPAGEMPGIIASLLARQSGAITAPTQARVAVNGDNVVLDAGGTAYRDVQIQNLGTSPLAIRLDGAAAFAGTNGEFFIPGGAAANDGTGGIWEGSGIIGAITGASGAAINVSVTQFK